MKTKILLSMMAIIMAVAMITGGTMAYFTDTSTSTSSTFTAGTLDISVNDGQPIVINFNNFAPGDVMQTEASIVIKNNGNLNLAWLGKMVAGGNDKLLDNIYVDSMTMEFLSPEGGANWEPTDQFIKDGVASGLYPDHSLEDANLGGLISLRKLVSIENGGMLPSSGYQNMGALKPGYSYRLTFKFGLYKGAGNECMGKTAYVTYTADATQINVDALNATKAGFGNCYDWLNLQIAKQP